MKKKKKEREGDQKQSLSLSSVSLQQIEEACGQQEMDVLVCQLKVARINPV